MIYNQLKQDPYFRLGLLIKVLAILFFIPSIQETWFVPFLVNFIQNPSINPWASFVEINADTLSFPYGVPMLLAHLPTTALGWITDGIFGTNYFTGLGFRVSLLIADIACLFTLCELKNKYYKTLVKLYWLSPVVFLIIYWHGQTDIIPVSLLFLGAVFAFKGKLKKSITFNYLQRQRSQNIKPLFFENGAIYIFNCILFKKIKNRIIKPFEIFEMEKFKSIDLDTVKDLIHLRKIFK